MRIGAFHFGPRARAAAALLERDGRRRFWARMAVDAAVDPRTRLRASQTLAKSEKDFEPDRGPNIALTAEQWDALTDEELDAIRDRASLLDVITRSWHRLVRQQTAAHQAPPSPAIGPGAPYGPDEPYERWPATPTHVIDGAASPPTGTHPDTEGR